MLQIEFPQLQGSEKQIAWAEKIRRAYAEVHARTHLQRTQETVSQHPEARYWIDNRYGMGTTNAEQREMQKLWSDRQYCASCRQEIFANAVSFQEKRSVGGKVLEVRTRYLCPECASDFEE